MRRHVSRSLGFRTGCGEESHIDREGGGHEEQQEQEQYENERSAAFVQAGPGTANTHFFLPRGRLIATRAERLRDLMFE